MRLANKYQIILLTISVGLVLSFFMVYKNQKLTERYIEIVFQSDRTGLIQVFWDTGQGFNGEESSVNSIRMSDKKTSVFLKAPTSPFSQIRLDPNNSKGEFLLYEFRFVNGAGDALGEAIALDSFHPHSAVSILEKNNSFVKMNLTSNDPMLLVDVSDEIVDQVIRLENGFLRDLMTVGLVFGIVLFLCVTVGGLSIPIIAAWMTWEIFNPGIFSPDSFDQYEQALRGIYHNWHPPILALVLRGILHVGLEVEHLILLQVVAGYVGLYGLISKCLCFLDQIKEGNLGVVWRFFINVVVFLLLVSPLTPYSAFLCTYWKDVWLMIALIWIVNLSIHMASSLDQEKPIFRIICELLGFTLLAVLSIAVRYNAIVLIPVYAGIVFVGIGFNKYWKRALGSLLLVMTCFSYKPILNASVQINDLSPKQSVMGLELVGLQILFPKVADQFPYTSGQLKEGFREKFRWAGYRYMKWGDDRFMEGDFVRSGKNQALVDEYWYAVKKHFWKVIAVKSMNFIQILDPRKTTEWCTTRISTNDFGVRFNRTFQPLRHSFVSLNNQVSQSSWLRLFSAVYLPWFLAVLAVLVIAIKKVFGNPSRLGVISVFLTLIPIGYTFSYLLACVWKAFRYISPSMILIQCFVLSYLFYHLVYWLLDHLKKPSKSL